MTESNNLDLPWHFDISGHDEYSVRMHISFGDPREAAGTLFALPRAHAEFIQRAIEAYSANPDASPARFQRRSPISINGDNWIEVNEEDIPHYRRAGQEIRALYAAPAATNADLIECCARIVEENIIQDTSAGKVLVPRQEGDLTGLPYAAAIRALSLSATRSGANVLTDEGSDK